MEFFSAQYLIWAIMLGAISAFSLPLGSFVGLQTKLRPNAISVLAAFGAGALIAALAVELVAPTVFALEADNGGHTTAILTPIFTHLLRSSCGEMPVRHARSDRECLRWISAKNL